MPQITILKNLVKFVLLTEKEFRKSLTVKLAETKDPKDRDKIERQLKMHQSEFPIFLEQLEIQFEEGMCFGFSICHGVMQEAHQLEWWESALRLIADWQNESLDETIHFFGKAIPRKIIFERVLNYIYFTSAAFDNPTLASFQVSGTTQNNILIPSESKSIPEKYSLEYIDDKMTHEIRKNIVIAGSFTIDQLERVLEKNLRGNELCIVISEITMHAVRIGKKDGTFIIYDPNYNHAQKSGLDSSSLNLNISDIQFPALPIYKTFTNLSEMLQELMRIQGESLAIELASFHEEEFDISTYMDLVKNTPHMLIQNYGFYHIAHYNPDVCRQILGQAKRSPHILKILVGELIQSLDTWNTFHIVARYASEGVIDLLELAESKEGIDLDKLLPKLLIETSNNGWSGLHYIARYSPRSLPKLIQLAERKHSEELCNHLGRALSLKNSAGWAVLNFIEDYAPKCLFSLFKLGINNEVFCDHLAKALFLQHLNELKDVHTVINYPVNALIQLIDLAKTREGKNIYQLLNLLIVRQTSDGLSGLHELARYAPNALLKLVSLSEKKNGQNMRQRLGEALSLKNADNRTGLNFIVDYVPSIIPLLIKIAEQDKAFATKFNAATQKSAALKNTLIEKYIARNNASIQEHTNYSRFFIGASTIAVGGILIASTAAYLGPKTADALSTTCRKLF